MKQEKSPNVGKSQFQGKGSEGNAHPSGLLGKKKVGTIWLEGDKYKKKRLRGRRL